MKKIFLPFLLCCSSIFALAQDFSNKGKEFWIAYPAHIDGTASVMGIYLTASVNTTATIQVGPTTTLNVAITANQVTKVFLGTGTGNQAANAGVYLSTADGITVNAAIKIVSVAPIVVYSHIINSARSGATLVLPTPVLGTEYILPSYQSNTTSGTNGGRGEFAIVATQPNTTVEIIPSVAGFGNSRAAGVPYQITLVNAGDCYQLQSVNLGDISGTTVKSISTGTGGCKPIAVFSATPWSAFDCGGASGGDNLYQQVFPTRSWGKQFVTAPFIYRNYTIYRIYVLDATTQVQYTINGVTTTISTSSLNTTGKFYQVSSASPVLINANKAIMVTQYITSQNCNTGCATGSTTNACMADPEMVILNPVEQTLKDVTFFSAHANFVPTGQTQIKTHYVNIIINKNFKNTVKIDGANPAGTFIDIPSSNYAYLQEDLSISSATNPIHRVTADSSFSAIVYGYGQVESYGYNGGTNVIDLYQYITLQNQYASVNFPATCKGTPFKFSITLPYQPIKLKWDFNQNPNLTPHDSVVIYPPTGSTFINYDSSFVKDGKTLYVYKLTQDYIFSTAGTYTVNVIANNPTSDGCSGEQLISYDVTVYDKPIPDFTFTHTGCVSYPVNFSDLTNGLGRPTAKWKWEFGDAGIDSVKNPVHLYSSAGTGSYNVHMTSYTDIGCISDTIKAIPISSVPVAKFGVSDTSCADKTIVFSDSSIIDVGTIVKWYWDYGNGKKDTLSTNANTSQTYNSTGPYTITLKVQSSTGCMSTVYSKTVTVRPNPVADFSLPIVCLPVGAAQFTNLTTISDGTIGTVTYAWNFGDASSASTATNALHNYTATGPFTVKLTATSQYGCIKDSSKILSTIYAAPVSSFTVSSEVCLRDSTVFTDASNPGTGNTITNWYWNRNFTGGTPYVDTVQNFKYRYGSAGTYIVKMYYKTDKGCISDTMSKTTVVNLLPTPAFINSTPLCESRDVGFTSQSVPNAGNIVRWNWNMGNAVTHDFSASTPFNENYATYANYMVKHMVETNKGCKSDTLTQTITIHPLPQVGYILPEVCLADAAAVFTDTSKIADNSESQFTYLWTFNAGTPAIVPGPTPASSTIKNGSAKYNRADNYSVSLKVTSKDGCMVESVKAFTVNGSIPVADFTVLSPTALCSNIAVQVQDKSTVDFGSITKVEIYWDYINNPTVKFTENNPTSNQVYSNLYTDFQQPATKTFTIRFVAYSGGTCASIKTGTVTLNASPKVQFVTMPGICLDGAARQIAQATETGGVAGASPASMYYGTGVSSSGLFNPAIAGVGIFPIKYVYTSNMGCQDSATKSITVWPSPIANFGFSSPTCEKNDITFSDKSIANFSKIVKWEWDFGNSTTLVRNNANPFNKQYPSANTYNVTLKVTTDSGCSSPIKPKPVKVNYLPIVDFSLPEICLPDGNGQFNNLSTIPDGSEGLFSFRWNFADPNDPNPSNTTLKNPTHKYTALAPSGGYPIKLKVTSKDGCVDSLAKPFNKIYPQPKANFGIAPTSKEICLGDTLFFNDLSNGMTSAPNQWNWNFGDGKTSSYQNPYRVYADSGTFAVKLFVLNNQGCVSYTLTDAVTVHPYPIIDAGPDLFVLEGGTVQIKTSYYATNPSFLWSPPTYLNSDTLPRPNSSPAVDITYMVKLTGIGGCSDTSSLHIKVLRSPIIPNAFSPNGDRVNDTWHIEYLESYPGATVEIFDRGGRAVFKSFNYAIEWDGTINGKALPVGTYYYIINPKNGRSLLSGSVTILK